MNAQRIYCTYIIYNVRELENVEMYKKFLKQIKNKSLIKCNNAENVIASLCNLIKWESLNEHVSIFLDLQKKIGTFLDHHDEYPFVLLMLNKLKGHEMYVARSRSVRA